MNAIVAIVLATTLSADPAFEDYDAILGVWHGSRLLSGHSIRVNDRKIVLTPQKLGTLRVTRVAGGKIDLVDRKGEGMCGLYCIKGDSLVLMLSPPGKDRPESIQAKIVTWEELTKGAAERARRGEKAGEILSAMPDWYWRLWFFQRSAP